MLVDAVKVFNSLDAQYRCIGIENVYIHMAGYVSIHVFCVPQHTIDAFSPFPPFFPILGKNSIQFLRFLPHMCLCPDAH